MDKKKQPDPGEQKPRTPHVWLNERPAFEAMSDAELNAWIESAGAQLIPTRHLTKQGMSIVRAMEDRLVAAKSLFYMAEGIGLKLEP